MNQRLLAYAQLLRVPNVFTAFADIGLAGAATGAITRQTGPWLLVLAASGCLYLGGMVWNDYFDRHEDARHRPFRPIPSGRVSPRSAAILGCGLFAAALGIVAIGTERAFEGNTPADPLIPTLPLIAAILLYNRWLKRTPAGPLGMGLCRFLNVMLGASVGTGEALDTGVDVHLASVVGLYIVGVTWFARTEEGVSDRRQLQAAGAVMIAALGLALAVPLHLPEGAAPWYFPYLLVAFGFSVGVPVSQAIRKPDAKDVQSAVKRCILGLIVLDAVLATAFVGLPGLLILLLLPPALFLGKWVYST